MYRTKSKLSFAALFIILLNVWALLCFPAYSSSIGVEVAENVRQEFVFDNDIVFSSRFESARLNDIEKIGDDKYLITIEPESTPVNDSAWYAFSVVAKSEKKVTLKFRYRHGEHRYKPKISVDGINWLTATDKQFRVSKRGQAILKISVGPEKQWVSAQELNYSVSGLQKMASAFARREGTTFSTLGYSVKGRALPMLTVGEGNNNYVLILGRQHPPEVTGSIAQLSFLRKLSDGSELSQQFRRKFTAIVLPLMNPDGVENGHWRHNANGIDLNRDWYDLSQPETKSVATLVENILQNPLNKIWFAMDFHSTEKDVFYTVKRDLATDDYQLVDRWLDRLRAQFPSVKFKDRPGGLARGVSKNWFQKQWSIPALTYEVGDETPRGAIATIGSYSAVAMMEELLLSVSDKAAQLSLP